MKTFIFITIIVFCLLVPFASPGVKKRRDKTNNLKLPRASTHDFVDEDILFNVNGVSFTMLPIEGGMYIQNVNNGHYDTDNNDRLVHTIEIPSFYIGETLVTQELWNAVLGSKSHENSSQNGSLFDLKRPVEGVSNDACHKFLLELSVKTGKHFRLPTEAEWDFATCGDHKCSERIIRGGDILDSGLRLALN